MARFVRTHARLELLAYVNGKPGSLFDLALRPQSRSAYRTLIHAVRLRGQGTSASAEEVAPSLGGELARLVHERRA